MKALFILGMSIILFASCEQKAFYEENTVIPTQKWDYDFTPEFAVHISESQKSYDLFINLRHTAFYPYANCYVLLRQEGAGLKDTAIRYELKLAELDGKWTGNSAGNLYEHSNLIQENITFPDTGKYVFTIEQNMRDNPLIGVNDIGIKLISK
ncbi:gliding motility lipoprotein GldH [Sphingobacterium sp. HJSM2_6]|uniref:gliding motility lipoprotein GldH n=1 Tax=Sphingobacterium sp. HJSM2_6 TaxID=3366264 RepID=UPI003BBFE78E